MVERETESLSNLRIRIRNILRIETILKKDKRTQIRGDEHQEKLTRTLSRQMGWADRAAYITYF